jgi:hypothetical protein
MTLHSYGDEFNVNAAHEIVPHLMELMSPKSVIDVGCGIGTWASVFKEHGVQTVACLDGDHVPKDQLHVSVEEFRPVDLLHPGEISINREQYDLCLSLEVAEHLPSEIAANFIEFLCKCSDVIVFSAAIPGQTGENHINEQYPDYWATLFRKNGYEVLDAFRSSFWRNSRIEWWYRQNMFLVVQNDRLKDFQQYSVFDGNSYIHPECLEMYRKMVILKSQSRMPEDTLGISFWERVRRLVARFVKHP